MDADYLTTKIGALIALYTKTVGQAILFLFNCMFWRHIVKAMMKKYDNQGDEQYQTSRSNTFVDVVSKMKGNSERESKIMGFF